jgi:Cysteine-rich secretory protein family/CXCXC repeat
LARDKFVGHGPHGQRGKKDQYICENINAVFQTKRPRENKAIHEVSAGNADLPAVEKWYRENVRYNYNTKKMIRGTSNLFNRFVILLTNDFLHMFCTGHFSQLAWKGSQRLGVGVATWKHGREIHTRVVCRAPKNFASCRCFSFLPPSAEAISRNKISQNFQNLDGYNIDHPLNLETCKCHCSPDLPIETLQETHRIYGGVARFVFHEDLPNVMEKALRDANAIQSV